MRVARPFAVGLAVTGFGLDGPGSPRRRSDDRDESSTWHRVAMALAAYRAGFVLLDVIEAEACTGVTARHWARLRSLAVHTDADAVFVLGLEEAEFAVLNALADELRLIVRSIPADAVGPPLYSTPGTGAAQ